MQKLINTKPKLINYTSAESVHCLTLFIAPELDYFKGHFSQGPILAGVVQLDWAVEMIREYFSITWDVKDVEALKFQVVITPNMTVTLTVEQKKIDKYYFSFKSEKGQHSCGRILFKSAPNE